MKKKLFGIISVLVVVALLGVGCNGKTEAVGSVDDTQPVIIESEPVVSEPVVSEPEPSEPVVSEPVVSEPENEGDPDLAVLEVTEEFARANKCLCLCRKGRFYSLGPYITAEANREYFAGQKADDSRAIVIVDYGETIVLDNIPDVVLQDGDEIRDYSDYALYDEKFTKIDYCGYTVNVWQTPDGDIGYFEYVNQIAPTILHHYDNISQPEIRDSDGNVVDRGDMKKNQLYTFSWYQGIQYNEVEIYACSKLYSDSPNNEFYVLEKELTKEGYVIIDWSSLPSGTFYGKSTATLPFTKK